MGETRMKEEEGVGERRSVVVHFPAWVGMVGDPTPHSSWLAFMIN
jgi:hypothetical protein